MNAAAKAAVVSLTRFLAIEKGNHAITVNVVNSSNLDEKELTVIEARWIRDARYPIGCGPTVEYMVAAITFCASKETTTLPIRC